MPAPGAHLLFQPVPGGRGQAVHALGRAESRHRL